MTLRKDEIPEKPVIIKMLVGPLWWQVAATIGTGTAGANNWIYSGHIEVMVTGKKGKDRLFDDWRSYALGSFMVGGKSNESEAKVETSMQEYGKKSGSIYSLHVERAIEEAACLALELVAGRRPDRVLSEEETP